MKKYCVIIFSFITILGFSQKIDSVIRVEHDEHFAYNFIRNVWWYSEENKLHLEGIVYNKIPPISISFDTIYSGEQNVSILLLEKLKGYKYRVIKVLDTTNSVGFFAIDFIINENYYIGMIGRNDFEKYDNVYLIRNILYWENKENRNPLYVIPDW